MAVSGIHSTSNMVRIKLLHYGPCSKLKLQLSFVAVRISEVTSWWVHFWLNERLGTLGFEPKAICLAIMVTTFLTGMFDFYLPRRILTPVDPLNPRSSYSIPNALLLGQLPSCDILRSSLGKYESRPALTWIAVKILILSCLLDLSCVRILWLNTFWLVRYFLQPKKELFVVVG